MLTKESCLHYWSSRYGINPRVGGRPVFTRNSAGVFTTQEGELDGAIVNTPRSDWATVSGERRKVLLLELARTNLVDADFSSWSAQTITLTGSQPDPAGGAAASKLDSTVAGGHVVRVVTFTGNATKGISFRLKAGTAATSWIGLDNSTAWRHLVLVTWTNGVPTLSTVSGSGSLFPVRPLGGGWYEIEVGADGVVAAETNRFFLYPAAGGTGTVYAFRPQAENGPFPTSSINGFSATRAADSCYWNFPPVPQGMMAYSRHIERGSILNGGVLWNINSLANANPQLLVGASGGFYIGFHHNGTSSVFPVLAAAPSLGDTVELVLQVAADGSLRIVQSINGAAVSSAGFTAALALPAAWSDTKLIANGQASSTLGATGLADLKFVKYADVVASTAQGIMDELRSFEVGPNSEVL